MNDNLQEIHFVMTSFFDMTSIPYSIFSDGKAIEYIPDTNFMRVFTNLAPKKLFSSTNKATYAKGGNLLYFGQIKITGTKFNILLGPIMEVICNNTNARQIQSDYSRKNLELTQIIGFFRNIPCYTDVRFCAAVSFLNYIFNKEIVNIYEYPNDHGLPEYQNLFPKQSETAPHNTNKYEKELFSYIKFGQPEKIEEFVKKNTLVGYMGNFTTDPLRRIKNLLICSTVLSAHSAIAGGLDYETAKTMQEEYMRKIELTNDTKQLYYLNLNILIDYAQKVTESRLGIPESIIAIKLNNYIRKHLYEPIKVIDIAKHFKINSAYLSQYLQKEIGISPKEFISRSKIQEAKRLLETTDMTATEIAYALCYSSHGHFHSVFKNQTGITPKQYRNNQKEIPSLKAIEKNIAALTSKVTS